MSIAGIVGIITLSTFLLIGLLALIGHLLDNSKIIFESSLLTIRYKNLSRKQRKAVEKWLETLDYYLVFSVFNKIRRTIDVSYYKMEQIKLTVKPEVFIGEEKVRAKCSPCGKFCEIEFGENDYMTSLAHHEIGHAILFQNNAELPEGITHHTFMAKLGF